MTKEKNYIIRKIGFEYGDDYFYNLGMAEYYDSFTDLEAAKDALAQAENKIYREYFLIQFLFGDEENSPTMRERAEEFDEYLQNHFSVSVKKGLEDWNYNMFFKIPESATDSQVEDIREILKISFHTIIEIEKKDDKENKYVISNYDPNSHMNQGEYANPLFFQTFNTENEAYSAIIQKFGFKKGHNTLTGFRGDSMEAFSDLPALFKAYLDNCSAWKLDGYFDYRSIIRVESSPIQNAIIELKGLLPLLKNPPFKIIQI